MVIMTSSQPTTLSELQLYKVLQRANLLQYYDIFIQQGGDDVQQLCEAGEEEFLEIMALVGMAAKPLHVRRLQKSLHDWMKTPSLFQQPMSYLDSTSSSSAGGLLSGTSSMNPGQYMYPSHHSPVITWDASPIAAAVPSTSPQRAAMSPRQEPPTGDSANDLNPSDTPSPTPVSAQMDLKRSPSPASSVGTERTSYSPGVPAVLSESQISAIADCAKQLSESLPEFQPKPMNVKKQIGKEIEDLMNMPMDETGRLELMRKYGAIYGRFDSKRKLEKPMSLHEVSVNEASAHLCFYIPALLTRREDLFPLARQVVRESGYQYAKGHSRAHGAATPTKRPKLEPKAETYIPSQDIPDRSSATIVMSKSQREARIEEISEELNELAARLNSIKEEVPTAREAADYSALANLQRELESLMSRQVVLVIEQNELRKKGKRGRPRKQPLVITPGPDDQESSKHGSDSSSHQSEVDLDLSGVKSLFSPIQPQGQGQSSTEMKEIMFDEGLRIAKQFGLQDFAEELIGLKTEVESGHEEGGQVTEVTEGQKVNDLRVNQVNDLHSTERPEEPHFPAMKFENLQNNTVLTAEPQNLTNLSPQGRQMGQLNDNPENHSLDLRIINEPTLDSYYGNGHADLNTYNQQISTHN